MKRIGKIFYFIILSLNLFLHAESVELFLESTDGIKLRSAAIGVPFVIKVVINNPKTNYEKPEIDGIDNLKVLKEYPSRYQKIFINNKESSTQIISFLVSSEKVGKFTLGPASIASGKQSNSQEIEVKYTQVEDKNKSDNVSLNLVLKNKNVFVGQKVPFNIVFEANNSKSKFQNIELPKVENLKLSLEQQTQEYQKVKDGKVSNFVKIKGFLVPTESGSIVLPAVKAKYYKGNLERHDPFDIFDNFFGVKKINHIFSDSIILDVSPLPETKNEFDAVGKFKNLIFSLKTNIAKQFEGITATLSIEGDGDLESLKYPKLNLGKDFKYYESNSYIKGDTKYFEYVLQGLTEGDFVIPEQFFRFFDTDKKQYKKLKTKPISIIINKSDKQVVIDTKTPEILEIQEESETKDFLLSNTIQKLKEINVNKIYIPWTIYFIILLILILIFVVKYLINLYYIIQEKRRSSFSKVILFDAKRELIKKYKSGEFTSFSFILNKYLSRFFTGSYQMLTDEEILLNMKKNNFEENIINDYSNLNTLLLNYSLYAPISSHQNIDSIYKLLIKFIDNLINVVKRKKNVKALFFFLTILFATNGYSNQNEALEDVATLLKIQKNTYGSNFHEINNAIGHIRKIHNVDQNYYNYFYNNIMWVPIIVWQILLLFFILILFFNNKINRLLKILVVCCNIFLLVVIIQIIYNQNSVFGIANKADVPVYIGPDLEYPQKDKLNFLNQVRINNIENSWYYVSSPEVYGWVNSENINII